MRAPQVLVFSVGKLLRAKPSTEYPGKFQLEEITPTGKSEGPLLWEHEMWDYAVTWAKERGIRV